MVCADIIIDISHGNLDKSFQYLVPEWMQEQIRPGMVVTVPFGKGNGLRKGYVIGLGTKTDYDPQKLKEIQGLASGEETTESRLIELAAWMRERYGSTMIQALKTVLPIREKVKSKEKRYICLNTDRAAAEALLQKLRGGRAKARVRFLEALLEKGTMEYSEAAEYGAGKAVLDFFEKEEIIRIRYEEITRTAVTQALTVSGDSSTLTDAQRQAADAALREWEKEKPRPVLLYGVTGSGKTQVYMELIDQVLQEGKQAIVLIPEIALTYQTVRRFYGRFGDRVSILNSRMSQGERYDQFKMAKKGAVQVMVGPRSALFTPFPRLGLIIVDEEHEPTYKSENSPRFHAVETAVRRAEMEGAGVLLGSATPSVDTFFKVHAGEYAMVRLAGRYGESRLPEVSVVDLREELKAGNRSVLSRELKRDMESRLQKKEQIMLFLNRRGYAGFVSCRSCGEAIKCPHCDVSLSEHNNGKLICHYCGYEVKKPEVCPVCGSPYIGGFKAGTQQVEQVIRKNFPGARVLRMDYDTTRKKGSYETILSAFARQEADILVGTQMIVKGHDFPMVTLVGVLAADLSLNAGDYHSAERTFQLLTQAVGRAGRGMREGKAVIQTYHPEHYSIQTAACQDYEAFYEEEMAYREMMDYPPASHMLAVLGACTEEALLKEAMEYVGRFVRRIYPGEDLHVIGPAPASIGKMKDVYKRVLYLKHREYSLLVSVRERLERYIEANSGFRKIYIQYDFS